MAKQFFLPDGGYVTIPDTMSFEEADAKARQKFPEAYGITQQHGLVPAFKAGLKEGVGAGIKGIGALIESPGVESYGTQMMAPDTTPGAYRETTGEDVSRAFQKGIMPGVGAWKSKYITEPIGGMAGRYVIPTAIGAGAAMLAPEAAGAAALARGAGFVAADLPSEVGENIQRQEQVSPGAPIDKTSAVAAGLAQAALLPVFGTLGGRATQYFKLMGPDLAASARAVASGQMSQEAAIAALNSTAKNMLVKTGEAAAIGAPMMVGTEALRTAQSGEDVTGAPAMGRYGEALEAAAAFAPLGGMTGMLGRRGQVQQLEQAGDIYRGKQAEQEAAAQREAAMQQALQGTTDVTGQLGLEAPKQPKGAEVYRGAGAPQPEDALNRGFFNALGLPNKGVGAALRKYEGTPLADPKIQDVRDTLTALIDPENAPKWMTDTKAAKIQAVLDSPVLKQHVQEAAPEQADLFAPRRGEVSDLFTGESRPPASATETPAAAPIDPYAAERAQFDEAQRIWQETGDDTPLRAILDKAKQTPGYTAPLLPEERQAFAEPVQPTPEESTPAPTEEPAPAAPEQAAEPAPAEKPKKKAPKVEEQIAPEVTEQAAASAWEYARDNSPSFPAYTDLHPDAQEMLRAKMELNNGELSGKDFKAVSRAHNASLRSERIAQEVKAELDPEAAMRHGDGVEAAHTKSMAETMVNNIASKWTNAPKVEVKNTAELEPNWRAWVEQNNPKGFIKHDGTITILADRNANLADVKATLFHEALGHYGLRTKFRSELNTLLGDIYKTNKEVRSLADAERADNPKLTPEQAVEEVLSERQIEGKPLQHALNRIIAMVRNYLRRIGLVNEYTDNDIVSILRQAHEAVTKGPRAEPPMVGQAAARKRGKTEAVPEEPRKTPAHGVPSRVFARSEVEKTVGEKIREFTGAGNRNPFDYLANKTLGRAHSVLGKLSRAGETGAYSKLNKGRVTAEAANAQGNNAIGIVSQARALGYMTIDKMGRVKAVEDKQYNTHTMNRAYEQLRDALVRAGYKEQGASATDVNTADNMMSLALFGPRLHELVKSGQFDKSFFTDHDKAISDKLRADPRFKPHIDEFQKIYNEQRKRALDAMVASGLYDATKAKEFMDRTEYLPLNRMEEELQGGSFEPTSINSLLTAAKEYHLGEGSDYAIGNPMVNAFDNLNWLNVRAIKNNTANILGESLVAVGSAKWQKTKPANDPHVISFNRDGKQVHLRLTDLNDASAFSATPVLTGMGWNIARKMSNAVRRGVTIMPGFIWGQTSQDAQRVAVMTGQSYAKAYSDIAKGVARETKSAWKGERADSPEQAALRSYGVVAARDYADTMDNFRKEMLDKKTSKWYHVLERLEQAAAASDGAAREAAYKKRFAETGDEFEAQHAARMLIDFNNRGNSRTLAALMTVAPFINARIQGTHRMVDALRGKVPGMDKKAAQQMAMMQVGKLMAFTLAYAMVKQDDPEYENETLVSRDNNFMFPGGLKMPVAGELLPFKVLAETTARQMMSDPNEDWSKSRASMANAVSSVLLGPSDLMPSLVRPIVEQATNHSFSTGHALISKGLEQRSASQQFTKQTTEVSKAMAEGIEDVVGMLGMKGISPIILENYLTSWTGRTGQEALNLLRLMESGAGVRPAPTISQVPFVGSMFMNPQGNALRADFQDVVDKVATAQADLKALRDSGDFQAAAQFQKENQDILALHSQLVPIQQRLTALNKQSKMGEQTAEKRDRLYAQQLQILQKVHELRQKAGF